MASIGKLSIRVFPDTSRFKSETRAQLAAAQKQLKVNAEVHAQVSQASVSQTRARLAAIGHDMKTHLTVDAKTRAASAALGILTRPRTAEVRVVLQGLDAAKAGLASLTGANIGSGFVEHAKEIASSFDQIAARAGAAATQLAALSAVGATAAGNLAQVAVSMAQVAGAGLALPGIFFGFLTGMAASADGLQNIHIELGKFYNGAGRIMDTIRDVRLAFGRAFWDEARAGLAGFVENAFDPFLKQYVAFGPIAGKFWSEFFQGISNGMVAVGGMARLFEPLRESFAIATEAAAPFTDAMVRLGAIGGDYLPRMATATAEAALAFHNWVVEAGEAGRINEIIDRGITNAKLFGGILIDVAGIINGVAKAAEAAGGGGLQGLAAAFDAINKAVNGPLMQGALTTVFEGAFAGMKNLTPGLSSLAGAFEQLAPTIGRSMEKAGAVVSILLDGIAQALRDPAISDGINKMFDGLVKAAIELAPAFSAAAPAVGALLGAIGEILPIIAPLITQVVQGLAPAFAEFKQSLAPVVEVLANALSEALKVILPIVADVVKALAEFMRNNPQLAATILAVVGALAPLAPIIGTVVSIIGTIVSVIGGVIGAFGAIGGVISTAVSAFGTLIGVASTLGLSISSVVLPIAGLVLGIGALAAGFIAALATSEQFRNALGQVIGALIGIVAPIIEAVLPALGQIAEGFMNMVNTVIAALVPMVTKIVEIAAAVLGALVPVAEWLGKVLGPAFDWLGGVVKAVFELIGKIIADAVNIISGVLDFFLAALTGNWDKAWGALGDILKNAWKLFEDLVGGGLSLLRDALSNAGKAIADIWNSLWNGIGDFLRGAWEGIVGKVKEGAGRVTEFLKGLPKGILDAIGNLGDLLKGSGSALIGGFIDGIKGAANGLKDAVKGVLDGIAGFFPHSPAKVGPFSGRGYTTHSGKALIGDFAGAIRSGRDEVADAAGYALGGADFSPNAGFRMVGTPVPATVNPNVESVSAGNEELTALLSQLAQTLGNLEQVDSRAFLQMKREAERIF